MDEYDDNDMRASMLNEDAQRDRRLIMKKMQQRQRSIRQSQKDAAKAERRNSIQSGDGSNSIIEDDDNDSVNEELLYEIQAAHEAHAEDEELIGYGDEGIDAIQASLTSPPSTWWAMRKQWQKRKGNVMDKIGALKGNSDEHLPDNYNMDGGGGGEDGIDHDWVLHQVMLVWSVILSCWKIQHPLGMIHLHSDQIHMHSDRIKRRRGCVPHL